MVFLGVHKRINQKSQCWIDVAPTTTTTYFYCRLRKDAMSTHTTYTTTWLLWPCKRCGFSFIISLIQIIIPRLFVGYFKTKDRLSSSTTNNNNVQKVRVAWDVFYISYSLSAQAKLGYQPQPWASNLFLMFCMVNTKIHFACHHNLIHHIWLTNKNITYFSPKKQPNNTQYRYIVVTVVVILNSRNTVSRLELLFS